MRSGAHDVIPKPVPVPHVLRSLGFTRCDGAANGDSASWGSLKDASREYVTRMYGEYRTISATARALGLDRKSLRRMLDRYSSGAESPGEALTS